MNNNRYCKFDGCYSYGSFDQEYCSEHKRLNQGLSKEDKTFSNQVHEAFQTMEERVKALENTVKLLKRELGLK